MPPLPKPAPTLPQNSVTDEGVWLHRRTFLSALGLVGGALWAGPALAAASRPQRLPGPVTPEEKAIRFNNFYEFTSSKTGVWELADKMRVRPWAVEITGLVSKPCTVDVDALLRRFGREERIYRHRCVEGWSAVIPWEGFPLRKLVAWAQPLSSARYVAFTSFLDPGIAPGQARFPDWPWPYTEGLTLAEAVHDLTLLATGAYGKPLAKSMGAPIRLVVPWKYGFKSAKSIVRIAFTEERPRTFWNTLAPHEYGFFSNVFPDKPHPRWSQATEWRLGTGERVPTLPYNGYAAQVAHLYR